MIKLIETDIYAIGFLVVCMFYILIKYPKMYPIQILFIIMIPAYIVAKWAVLDEEFALIIMIMVFLMNFFHLKKKFEN